MEKVHNIESDLRELDSDSDSYLSEGELLFGFLYPQAAGQPTAAADQIDGS